MYPRQGRSPVAATALWWVVFALACSSGGAADEMRGPDGPDVAVDATDSGVSDAAPDGAVDAAQVDLTITTGSDACVARAPDAGVGDGLNRFLDLVVKGQGFEDHEGKRVYVFTRESGTMTPLGYASDLVRAGQFTVRFPNGYARFSYQPIFYFADVDGDGHCDEAMGDHPGLTLSNAFNPGTNDPQEMPVKDNHRSMERGERVCDLMNACR